MAFQQTFPSAGPTFRQATEAYLSAPQAQSFEHPAGPRIGPGKRAAERFLGRIVASVGNTPPRNIDQAFVDRLAKQLYPKATPATLKRQVYGPVKAVLRAAAQHGMFPLPCIKSPPTHSARRMRWLHPDEYERLVTHAREHLIMILLFGVGTGARNCELLNLDWNDVDLDRREVAFPSRVATLPIELVAILRPILRKEGKLIKRPDGEPYTPKDHSAGHYKTTLRTACRAARVADFCTSDFATTFAAWHLALHLDYKKLADDSGWAPHVVRRYKKISILDLDRLRIALLASPPPIIPGGPPRNMTAPWGC